MLLYSALLLTVFIQLNLRCNSHWPATIGFVFFDAIVTFAIVLARDITLFAVLISAVLNLAFAAPFFFLLGRAQGSSHYWTILVSGIALYLGLSFFL